jgi:heme-degrading monooxygenase HmoA
MLEREGDMFASVRTYKSAKSVEEVGRRAESQFAPKLKEVPGFQGYYLVDGGGGTIVTVTLFDSREAADASAEKAREWISSALSDLTPPEVPTVVSGRVLVALRK